MDETDLPQAAPPAPQGRSDEGGRRLRRTLIAVGAGLGMTLAGLGIAAAQTGQSDTPTTIAPAEGERTMHHRHGVRLGLEAAAKAIGISDEELRTALRSGQSIAQVAQSKNVEVQKVIDAIVADAKAKLAEKVQSDDLTQAEADEKAAHLTERITDLVNRTGPLGHPGGHRHPGLRLGLEAAAKAIGISDEELRTALRSGQSIAQVAQSKNVEVQKVIDAIVADAKAKLAEKVQSGDLTQAEADEKAANLTERITDLVNRTGPLGHKHGPRPAEEGTTPS